MDTALLRTFLEVSRTRHFGKAAKNLYLTQSAVSARIRQLEELIGTPLLTRQRNNIMLTSSGERFIAHAENILAAWQVALQDVGVSEQQSTQLVLGGIPNLWATFLQSILPRLATEFPHTAIRTEINSQLELTRALLAGRLDVAVMIEPPTLAELDATQIGQIELVLVSSRAGASVEAVAEVGYVFVDWGTAFNLSHAKRFRKPVAPILHTEQSQIALEFLITYGGMAFLPQTLVAPYLSQGKLHRVNDEPTSTRDVYAVYAKNGNRRGGITPIIEKLSAPELRAEPELQPG